MAVGLQSAAWWVMRQSNPRWLHSIRFVTPKCTHLRKLCFISSPCRVITLLPLLKNQILKYIICGKIKREKKKKIKVGLLVHFNSIHITSQGCESVKGKRNRRRAPHGILKTKTWGVHPWFSHSLPMVIIALRAKQGAGRQLQTLSFSPLRPRRAGSDSGWQRARSDWLRSSSRRTQWEEVTAL